MCTENSFACTVAQNSKGGRSHVEDQVVERGA